MEHTPIKRETKLGLNHEQIISIFRGDTLANAHHLQMRCCSFVRSDATEYSAPIHIQKTSSKELQKHHSKQRKQRKPAINRRPT